MVFQILNVLTQGPNVATLASDDNTMVSILIEDIFILSDWGASGRAQS
jgi:hypothetical protein